MKVYIDFVVKFKVLFIINCFWFVIEFVFNIFVKLIVDMLYFMFNLLGFYSVFFIFNILYVYDFIRMILCLLDFK